MTHAGHAVGAGPGTAPGSGAGGRGSDAAAGLSERLQGGNPPAWQEGPGLHPRTPREVTPRDLLTGTSFAFTADTGRQEYLSEWGRGAAPRFDGREGSLSLDGEVASAGSESDAEGRRTLAGIADRLSADRHRNAPRRHWLMRTASGLIAGSDSPERVGERCDRFERHPAGLKER